MEENVLNKPIDFACPKDKHPLHSIENTLHCIECNRTYPITDGIPDFLTADTQANAASVYGGTSKITTINRMARRMDFFAPIYESRWFVSTLLRLSGIRGDTSRFMEQLARFHARTLLGITGSILDVACGPATYSRRVASPSMIFYGIDISMGMLRQGQAFIERDHIAGVHLARARVEELPFEEAVFDGVICSGSLHLFSDTALALGEIGRTMKPGAPLSVQTFIAGKTPINRFLQGNAFVHTFQPDELERYLTEAGFTDFQPELDGILLTFSAKKAIQ